MIKRVPLLLLLALSSLLFACADDPELGVVEAACQTPPPPPPVAPLGETTHGKSYLEWTETWWQFMYAIPRSTNPIEEGDCAQNQAGDVWFLAGNHGGTSDRHCHVPAHTALFFPVLNKICKQCPELSCAAAHNTDLDVCSSRGIDQARSLFMTIDGNSLVDVATQRVKSLPFTWTAPTNPSDQVAGCIGVVPPNSCGIAEGARFGQTDGYWIMLEPLAPGEHTLHFGGVQPTSTTDFVLDVTYHLTVD